MKHLIRLGIASAFFSMLALFSIASPPGSAPDEPFHIYSGWCLQDETGFCETVDTYQGSRLIQVPEKWAHANCYAFHPETSASCIDDIPKKRMTDVAINQGAYPSGYYALLSVLLGNDEKPNTYDARILISFLISLIFLAIIYLGAGNGKPAMWIVPILLLAPLPFFLASSLNPSGLAFALGVLKILLAIRLLDETKRSQENRLIFALIAVSIVEIQIRRDSALLFAIAMIGFFLIHRKTKTPSRRGKIAIFASVTIALVAAIRNQQVSSALSGGLGGVSDLSTQTLVIRNFVELPDLYIKSIVGSLGWNDTHLFGVANYLPILALGGIFSIAAVFWKRSSRLGILFVGVSAVAIPITLGVLTAQTFSMQSIQGRYVFPLLVALVAVASPLAISSREIILRLHTLLNATLAASLVVSLWILIWRFSTGLAVEMESVPESLRWWPWPWIPELQIFAFSVSAFLFLLLSRINMKQNLERTHSALN